MEKIALDIWRWISHWFQFLWWCVNGRPAPEEWTIEQNGSSTIYRGTFAVYGRGGLPWLTVKGRIVEWRGLATDVYLFDPPAALRNHPHGSCLQLLRPGESWFKLHWQKPARTFTESCAYVEQLLAESGE